MLTVKMLKPYYIKTDEANVRVVLAYQYFAIVINQQVYQFVPIESEEIRMNRRTGKVENVGARFTFQKGKEIIYLNMTDLTAMPEFMAQLQSIVKPYMLNQQQEQKQIEEQKQISSNQSAVIEQLEHENVKRLIDKALDERDKETFNSLVKFL
ncbi:hypothetical protein GCM10008983_25810 [Lentibacillus halophilus]|uniref:IDEAL domain-containing protein n=1 Tax=Lentibacillus halophilus TaxID=295065 RepID=A0ABN0ZGF3_9BACI